MKLFIRILFKFTFEFEYIFKIKYLTGLNFLILYSLNIYKFFSEHTYWFLKLYD